MWIYDSPPKILLFKEHINNLVKSIKAYNILKPFIKRNILKLLKKKINTKKNIIIYFVLLLIKILFQRMKKQL